MKKSRPLVANSEPQTMRVFVASPSPLPIKLKRWLVLKGTNWRGCSWELVAAFDGEGRAKKRMRQIDKEHGRALLDSESEVAGKKLRLIGPDGKLREWIH